ncbi:Glycosyltransferase involved in cell wall bisynthesis [Desulfocicer vacuolatum DSM 3385]|uniref:Glycosyltransferase involved in cell wall bisynthesis n=1 Tax=Desulfocicer vacuolatum DSM 3385 TaxID=1121400 RepID=A0A1W1Z231_9BACT|nr:glycosyltransferase family 4 protein [Desulfocicer vacuolatum]SMC42489.1 Glycosyltransferase involved in cell wall bisynthesis [Desulfocicer vacuolatum DSM 3385]
MRILILSQWCQPEPFFKGIPFAKALQARGHEVEILTGFPNYPNGKIYPGYKVRLFHREVIDSIPVNRVALYPSHNHSGFHRILNYMSFAVSAALIGPLLVKKPDVIYAYNLITLDWAAWLLKKIHGCPVVLDIQDLWPDSVIDSGMMRKSNLMHLLSFWCNNVYRRASHLTTLSPGFKNELVKRGVPKNNVSVIYNWCDETNINTSSSIPSKLNKLKKENPFIVMFAGTMGVMQGLDTVLDAAENLLKIEPQIKFVLVGGGIECERMEESATRRNLENVVFLERQPPEKINALFQMADVLLVHLKDIPLFQITIPSKIQAYMAAGKPILLGVKGDSADIVRESEAGVMFTPESPESMLDGILELYNMTETERKRMGLKGSQYYRENLSMNAGVKKFEKIFHELKK